jgi:hypothetical protein
MLETCKPNFDDYLDKFVKIKYGCEDRISGVLKSHDGKWAIIEHAKRAGHMAGGKPTIYSTGMIEHIRIDAIWSIRAVSDFEP